MSNPTLPRRGDVWLVNFNPGRGSEQQGIRPAMIIQNDTGNEYAATTIVAAITTTIKVYPVTFLLEKGEGGLPRRSMVNLAQILTIDKHRFLRKLGTLPAGRGKMLDNALKISLALE